MLPALQRARKIRKTRKSAQDWHTVELPPARARWRGPGQDGGRGVADAVEVRCSWACSRPATLRIAHLLHMGFLCSPPACSYIITQMENRLTDPSNVERRAAAATTIIMHDRRDSRTRQDGPKAGKAALLSERWPVLCYRRFLRYPPLLLHLIARSTHEIRRCSLAHCLLAPMISE